MGDRVSDAARAAIRFLHGAAAGASPPRSTRASTSSSANPSGGNGSQPRGADLRDALAAHGIAVAGRRSHIVPVVIGDNDRARRRGRRAAGARVRRARHPAAERAGRHGAAAHLGQRRSRPMTIDRSVRQQLLCARLVARGSWASACRGLFVTGTDTGVGKTVVSAALLHRLRATVPSATGSRFRPASSRTTTRPRWRRSARCAADELLDGRRPAAAAAVAASGGAARAASTIELPPLVEHSRRVPTDAPGSSKAPAACSCRSTIRDLMVDLMARLALPVVIVARSGARHDQSHAADARGAASAGRWRSPASSWSGRPNAGQSRRDRTVRRRRRARRDAALRRR